MSPAVIILNHSVMAKDPDYFTAVKADRPEDMVQYTYNELCFNMDLWNGKPGQAPRGYYFTARPVVALLQRSYIACSAQRYCRAGITMHGKRFYLSSW